MSKIIKKYAWVPKYVKTWRPHGTNAIIWLQPYYKNEKETYCRYLGCFSYEFW
jgi:hypothetical protein